MNSTTLIAMSTMIVAGIQCVCRSRDAVLIRVYPSAVLIGVSGMNAAATQFAPVSKNAIIEEKNN